MARPDDGDSKHLLIDHLVSVANAVGSPTGSTYERIGFLAGLVHDAAKCHEDWQDYIQPTSSRQKGPPHSPMGAALFAFIAERLLSKWHADRKELQTHRDRMLNWLMAINGHHGRLGDFGGQLVPWMKVGNRYSVSGLIPGCDLNGVFELVASFFPDSDCSVSEFEAWVHGYDRTWAKLADTNRVKQMDLAKHNEVAMRYPLDFSALIIADRIHAGGFPDDDLSAEDTECAIRSHDVYCQAQASKALKKGASPEIVALRTTVQQAALKNFLGASDKKFYTLLLPTGYGKTLTSLRVALESCRTAGRRRIIYVAPYLSILSQATQEIEQATGLEVFQHHHLSLAATTIGDDADASLRGGDDRDDDFELLDTWKTSILTTTFNQFFRALFPSRAQQTLRIDALNKSIVIIDEPQIIDINVWSVFLRALSVFAEHHDCQILFTTATLPPLSLGLECDPVPLAPSVHSQHRYDIQYVDQPFDAESLTEAVCGKIGECSSGAVVLNTVRDAADVYSKVKAARDPDTRVYCLTAMMLPYHKRQIIEKIGIFLKRKAAARETANLIIVCTQMLEAGVDLSFRQIWRARSILPSIAQVAGRANRHGESDPSPVTVFPFHSRGEQELRRFVYRDRTANEITDSILLSNPTIPETNMRKRLDEYYENCWEKNNQMALMKLFTRAAAGEWSCLAGLEPFGFSPPREEIFVPIPMSNLKKNERALVGRFATNAEDLLSRYLDSPYRKSLSFRERKLIQIAVQLFIVPTRVDIAERIATQVNDWLWKIKSIDHYSSETGLAHWLVEEELDDPQIAAIIL
ncbi:MAG: CRISPR-associated endonuclease Cas3'' [Planctomycetales bacterium]|nr:CRISPR-associated endonuclease Cas3'' [Planctomycetales bacterium]